MCFEFELFEKVTKVGCEEGGSNDGAQGGSPSRVKVGLKYWGYVKWWKFLR